jgi:outer membrane biosynthesis protein TonB
MRWSLTTSLGLHVAILVAALVVLPSPDAFKVDPQPAIQVDISNISDVTKIMTTTKDAEESKDKPAPKKAETVKPSEPAPKEAKVEQKAVKEASAEPPPPEPKKEEPKKEEPAPPDPTALKDLIKDTVKDTPEPKKPDPPKPVDKPKPKKVEKKPAKFDPDQIAALLNKVDETKAPDAPSTSEAKPAKAMVNLQGTDDSLSATIIDAFFQKLKECWAVPPGAIEANIGVRVHFKLNPDGTVNGTPEIVDQSSDPLVDATGRSAVSAILDCQAYDFLPKDQYDLWKDNILLFHPNLT